MQGKLQIASNMAMKRTKPWISEIEMCQHRN